MLADITQYYSNETDEVAHNQFKRKLSVEIEVIGKCECCGSLLTSETDIEVDGMNVFCSESCVEEYIENKDDEEYEFV